MHGDHVGDRHIPSVNASECGKPDVSVSATPGSNTVAIAAATGAKIVTGSEMPPFFSKRLEAAGGDPKKSVLARFGASHKVGGVTIATVPASHSNGVSPAFLTGRLAELMQEAGLNATVGPPTGYVLTFSNGLVAYLSGDTGMTAEQDRVVRGFYGAELAVINISDTFVTGPREAAYVIDELVRPTSVIPSHANEPATSGGKVQAGTRTAQFLELVRTPAYLALSGKTREFDGKGVCVAGCD
jgi:L-ascorbate metabolism protein UlaG (beta-lactamase superfamily)